MQALTTCRQTLEVEVERGKVAVDSIRSQVESENGDKVESLTRKCLQYQQKIGTSTHVLVFSLLIVSVVL